MLLSTRWQKAAERRRMNPNTKRNILIGLCSIGSVVAIAGVVVVTLLAYTKRALAVLEFDEPSSGNE